MHAYVINLPILLYTHIPVRSILAKIKKKETKTNQETKPKPIYIIREVYLLVWNTL